MQKAEGDLLGKIYEYIPGKRYSKINRMNKYKPHIHHRKSFRPKGYDYVQAGLYFITICVQNRE